MAPSTITPDLVPEPVSKPSEGLKDDGSSLNEQERAEIAFVDKYSAPDVYINGDNDTLWFPWIGPIELKPMRIENRTGTFVVGLRSIVACGLGKHRHRGTVTAITISGEWGYKEYVTVSVFASCDFINQSQLTDTIGSLAQETGSAKTRAPSIRCLSRIIPTLFLPSLVASSSSTMTIA
jgi:hypothetical protein